ncbi:MAG: hypothetical protein A2Z62_01160 [Candidatus Terrybacteria bacterium RIFCSPLOWO2_02_42_20]|uniref:Uncharacterized protein n=1 Tax=Candidatus Terrybacteria bacterium RIFCSPLOWO2_02_42_20 TaxID=1802370 RepID=A0A1G2PY61_9BACT|nr:MAG: hypothetical protein A2Z62_01160 [Candidatus Terrybacteria bacterium RIFCSPLOWO2_02_42_20]
MSRKDEDIVHTISNNGEIYDVGSTYPGGGEAPKGLAVRQLKGYVSWVQTVVRQVGLLSAAGVRFLRSSALCTRGSEWTDLWCAGCPAKGNAG